MAVCPIDIYWWIVKLMRSYNEAMHNVLINSFGLQFISSTDRVWSSQ